MSAPGFWIRANPALLDAPGNILRAWTRDGSATVAVFRRETRQVRRRIHSSSWTAWRQRWRGQ